MLTWLAAMWWIRWGIATLLDDPDAPPPPVAVAPPLPAGDGLSERGDGVPLTLESTQTGGESQRDDGNPTGSLWGFTMRNKKVW